MRYVHAALLGFIVFPYTLFMLKGTQHAAQQFNLCVPTTNETTDNCNNIQAVETSNDIFSIKKQHKSGSLKNDGMCVYKTASGDWAKVTKENRDCLSLVPMQVNFKDNVLEAQPALHEHGMEWLDASGSTSLDTKLNVTNADYKALCHDTSSCTVRDIVPGRAHIEFNNSAMICILVFSGVVWVLGTFKNITLGLSERQNWSLRFASTIIVLGLYIKFVYQQLDSTGNGNVSGAYVTGDGETSVANVAYIGFYSVILAATIAIGEIVFQEIKDDKVESTKASGRAMLLHSAMVLIVFGAFPLAIQLFNAPDTALYRYCKDVEVGQGGETVCHTASVSAKGLSVSPGVHVTTSTNAVPAQTSPLDVYAYDDLTADDCHTLGADGDLDANKACRAHSNLQHTYDVVFGLALTALVGSLMGIMRFRYRKVVDGLRLFFLFDEVEGEDDARISRSASGIFGCVWGALLAMAIIVQTEMTNVVPMTATPTSSPLALQAGPGATNMYILSVYAWAAFAFYTLGFISISHEMRGRSSNAESSKLERNIQLVGKGIVLRGAPVSAPFTRGALVTDPAKLTNAARMMAK
jgi:hypothetical protein